MGVPMCDSEHFTDRTGPRRRRSSAVAQQLSGTVHAGTQLIEGLHFDQAVVVLQGEHLGTQSTGDAWVVQRDWSVLRAV
jgi:hypothetical protein